MKSLYISLIALLISCTLGAHAFRSNNVEINNILFNFMSEEDFTEEDINCWYESSDPARVPGKSKGALVLQKTQLFQRAVFFALLNPQPDGACFAGMLTNVTHLDLSELAGEDSQGLVLQVRAQGAMDHYKITMTNTEFFGQDADYMYEAKFQLEKNTEDFQTVTIPWSDFHAYHWGYVLVSAPPLDLGKIGVFGLQVYGGVFDEYAQTGVGSLELDFIAFY